jgi:formylglycine-generating enzyme required for sulfatase activity
MLALACSSAHTQPAADRSAETSRSAATSIFRDCEQCPEMVVIPAGEFLMGTPKALQVPTEVPAELDPVQIRISKPFALGRFEVTRAEFAAFVSDSGFSPVSPHCRTWIEALQGFRDLPVSWNRSNVPAQPQIRHPASCIDWHDSQAYVAWLSRKTGQRYRLPSETEWEYAARAGSRTLRHWGNEANKGCAYANLHDRSTAARYPLAWTLVDCNDGHVDVAPVGSLKPNAFGLYDMIGNVWEWAEDCASLSYFGRPEDERAWVWDGGCKRRIQRGGGWITGPERARSGFHGDGHEFDRAEFSGLRVARDL